MEWIASTAFGLEGPAYRELRKIGLNATPQDIGGVRFEGDAKDGLKANLLLRCADRVLMVCAQGEAKTFEDLFQLAGNTPWEKWLPKDAKFPVRAQCARSQIMSPSDCQAIVKKAIAGRLSRAYRCEWMPETGAVYQVDVSIRRDQVLICLDSSGDALNKRGYRTWNGEAPLRETLAASLLSISPWHPGIAFCDPMCGTGTIAIEAALMAYGRAPGMMRTFAMERWSMLRKDEIARVREEAAAFAAEAAADEPIICASDIDQEPLLLAKKHLVQAELAGKVRLNRFDAKDLVLPCEKGVIVTNPPYGERLGDRQMALKAAEYLGKIWYNNPGWTVCAITSEKGFEDAFGRKADKRTRLFNGRIPCEFMIFTCQNLANRNGGKRS
ncbi:MAG: class I SAM-dependent RNA methyltransferase [Clostridia bacterium]|nr:class I SAM-dependent RNA methyltransferase [Clostridia bacterium]